MAHIDTSTIQGFDGMSAEQKLAALLALDIPEKPQEKQPEKPDEGKWVSKALFDQRMSELAEAKRALKGKMTEEEQAAAARQEKEAEDQAKYAELQGKYEAVMKQLTVSGYKASYLSLGYDEKLAQETAEAMANGDMNTVFASMGKANAALESKIKNALMTADPKPGSGSVDTAGEDAAVTRARELAKTQTGGTETMQNAIKLYSV